MDTIADLDTIAAVDAELLRTHEKFLRADRRGDVTEAADLYAKLDDLLERRTRIPLQRPAHDD